ncbi:hypothetical protein BC628DRAFT_78910 [Trametes gibbosa]|nr:hypothetical protein BC628DRAFT_78910 [Trametes gibbosa]
MRHSGRISCSLSTRCLLRSCSPLPSFKRLPPLRTSPSLVMAPSKCRAWLLRQLLCRLVKPSARLIKLPHDVMIPVLREECS